jgi:hypothetical protein
VHEFVTAQYVNHLMDNTAATLGDVWKKVFYNYHANDPAVAESTSPGTRLYHIVGAYGNVLYGLPTQTIERVQTAPVQVNYRQTAEEDRAPLASLVLPTIEINTPHFQTETFEDGTTLFSIPNGGTHLAPTNGPALPLAIRTLTLPDYVIVMGVNLIEARSSVYGQSVTLARPQLKTATDEVISGTYQLPADYPEKLFQYRVVHDKGGQQLLLSVIPLRYDRDSHQVTLYNQMAFEVEYMIAAPAIGPQITALTVNDDQPLRINRTDQKVQVEIAHDQLDNARVMWTFKTQDSFVVASGNASIQIINGTTMVDIPVDSTGWSPGIKDLSLYVMHNSEISDSENIALQVEGVGVYDLAPQSHIYSNNAEAATWKIAVYDEQGRPVSNLSTITLMVPFIEVTVDGEFTYTDLEELGEGKYEVRLPLASLSPDAYRVRISATDTRGITGWREWSVTKLPPEGGRIYLPVVLKGVSE